MKVRNFLKRLGTWLGEFFNNIGNLIGAFLLIILAAFVFLVCVIPSMLWKIIFSFKKEDRKARDIISGTAKFFVGIAIGIDQIGNVAFGGFFNWFFLTNSKEYPFGNTHETISEVLGWNDALGNLNRKGHLLVSFLNVIESAHCQNAMQSGIYAARFKTEFYARLQSRLQTIEKTKTFLEKYS